MKKILLLTFFPALTVTAQSEGEISYITKVDLHAELPDDEQGRMIRGMIPQYQEIPGTLLFNPTQSLYTTGQGGSTSEEKMDDDGNNVQIKIEMDAPQENIYTDVKEGLVVEQRQLMDKIFLIRDTIDPSAWKITGDTKLVSGIQCYKATMDSDDGKIEAWYTPQIPVSTGPAGFGGLPGLIVHLSLNDGKMLITADKILARDLTKGEVVAPAKGKDVTREEFAELEKKKMEQMQKQYNTGEGHMIIITE